MYTTNKKYLNITRVQRVQTAEVVWSRWKTLSCYVKLVCLCERFNDHRDTFTRTTQLSVDMALRQRHKTQEASGKTLVRCKPSAHKTHQPQVGYASTQRPFLAVYKGIWNQSNVVYDTCTCTLTDRVVLAVFVDLISACSCQWNTGTDQTAHYRYRLHSYYMSTFGNKQW